MRPSHAAAIAAVSLAFAVSGCSGGSDLECGPGTRLVGETCELVVEPDGGDCVPECTGRDCGDDGCGGSCGTCPEATPDCDAASGVCQCAPRCAERTCGDDGCGGSCGTCSALEAPVCDELRGVCVATCVPACAGRSCGSDGCGGSCGSCESGSTCKGFGRCVPDTWTCDPEWFGAHDTCDCNCGARDTDCDSPGTPVIGCGTLERCGATGACESIVPSSWTCAPTAFGEGSACHCGCGARDSDCTDPELPVYGCLGDAPACNTDGTCVACTPDCDGKACGPDGCGGWCGTCSDPNLSACVEGACVSACSPTPVICLNAECGDDGCGGSCGSCAASSTCRAGKCIPDVVAPAPDSCEGSCGSIAPAGCACVPSCVANQTCCDDYLDQCSCSSDCTERNCGSDGCGGSCGTCSGGTPYCGDDGRCTASCTPDCDGRSCGSDGCGGSCGTCDADSVCAWTSQCVPKAWRCSVAAYGDQAGCDCGCGALDPDCSSPGALVIGCPTSTTTCNPSGICDVTFCEANASCGGTWCTGTYYRGGGRYGGVCDHPDTAAGGIGATCRSHGECATGVCADARCREYCAKDADCPGGQRCVGLPLRDSPSLPAKGFVGVCELLSGTSTACSAQAGCPGEQCTAHVHPVTLAPRYLCTNTPAAIGTSCAASACPAGLLCHVSGTGAVCTRPCPGGGADCPGGWSCGSMTFHNAGTPDPADDPTVPVCVRN